MARRWRSVRARTRPEISIVVPVYNVEPFIAECLESLAAQTADSIEFVVVNDGSTDSSMSIVEAFRRRDRRFRVVNQSNQGLGAARNAGMAVARGELIGFVDSDDVVPPDAYERLAASLRRSGSDFAVGNIARLRAGRLSVPEWAAELHATELRGAVIDDVPAALFDVFACNKLFRRSFLTAHSIAFPVGVHYEDQVPSVECYLRATGFDLLAEVTYHWRQRETGDSITQRTRELSNLVDRAVVTEEVAERLHASGRPALRTDWLDRRIIGSDVTPYSRAVADGADDGYVEVYQQWLRTLLADVQWGDVHVARPLKRLLAWVGANGTRADVRDVVEFERRHPHGVPIEARPDGGWRMAVPLRPELAAEVPDAVWRLKQQDHQLIHRLTRATLEPRDGYVAVEVAGQALVTNAPTDPGQVNAWFESPAGARVELEVEPDQDATTPTVSRNPFQDSRQGFFVARGRLPSPLPSDAGSTLLTLHLEATAGDVRRSSVATDVVGGSSAALASVASADGAQWVWGRESGVARVRVSRPVISVTALRLEAERLWLELASNTESAPAIRLASADGAAFEVEVSALAPGRWRADVPFEATHRADPVELAVESRSGARWKAVKLMATEDASLISGGEAWMLRPTLYGNARLLPLRGGCVVSATLDGKSLSLALSGAADDSRYVLREQRGREVQASVERGPSGPAATVVVEDHARALLISGTYTLTGPTGEQLRAAPSLLRSLPLTLQTSMSRVTLHAPGGTVELRVRPAVPQGVMDPYQQRELLERYEGSREDAATPSRQVLLESYYGLSASCSPRAIADRLAAEHPDVDLVWSVQDHSVDVGSHARRVVRWTPEWFDAVATSRFLVNNTNFPGFFRKRATQIYLQTWHGTPLKRIGHDILEVSFGGGDYLERMDREAATWDALISPNRYCTEIFPRAFAYDGPVLEIGYPRNDALVTDQERSRRRAFDSLGLDPGKKVVLYAPTWRDVSYRTRTGSAVAELFEVEEFVEALGETHQLVVRGHSNTARRAGVVTPGVVDATLYPDVNDLYSAADVLVTDYSSVMFDFAVTGRPIVFYTPDLEEYRDRYRGFYFDLEASAPGPLLRTTREVIRALSEPETLSVYAGRLEEFRERFCSLEDGNAARRAVDYMLAADRGGV